MRIVLVGVVLYASVMYLDGVTLAPTKYGIIVSFAVLLIVFSAIELMIYPVVKMFILPLRIITFGLASVALSVNLVYIVTILVPFFQISSLWYALLLGVGLGVVRLLTK